MDSLQVFKKKNLARFKYKTKHLILFWGTLFGTLISGSLSRMVQEFDHPWNDPLIITET